MIIDFVLIYLNINLTQLRLLKLGSYIRGRCKKNIKKLTNVSLYVCMSAENSKMLVFYVFFPNSSLKDNFQNRGFEPYWIVSWVQGVSKC